MSPSLAVLAAVDVGFARPRQAAVTLVTFAVVATLVAGGAALAYRWYFRTEIPEGVTGLIGVSVVALYLNTTSLGSVAVGDNPALLAPESVFFNLVSLGVAAVMAPVGRYAGDRLAVDVFALSGAKQLEGELSGVVRAVGRFTAVTIPPADEIGDMDTYDPVSPEKKAELAETTLLFPRKLSAADLRERLVTRIKDEYGVGYVDLDLDADGTVEYFAVGSRAAGLGPTLAPGSAAVAVAADPPNNATVGDTVQLWRDDPEPKRVATGELRGVAGDAVTVALDESDAERLTEEGDYRLVTLPAEPQADREFASLLRTADETMASVAVRSRE
ncbi:potassium transporter TrkA, partial [Halorubrum distributum]